MWVTSVFLKSESHYSVSAPMLAPDLQSDWFIEIKISQVDTVQDFLIKLGIKPPMHLLEIGIFSLYHVIIRPTKIMNRADKNWAHF